MQFLEMSNKMHLHAKKNAANLKRVGGFFCFQRTGPFAANLYKKYNWHICMCCFASLLRIEHIANLLRKPRHANHPFEMEESRTGMGGGVDADSAGAGSDVFFEGSAQRHHQPGSGYAVDQPRAHRVRLGRDGGWVQRINPGQSHQQRFQRCGQRGGEFAFWRE